MMVLCVVVNIFTSSPGIYVYYIWYTGVFEITNTVFTFLEMWYISNIISRPHYKNTIKYGGTVTEQHIKY